MYPLTMILFPWAWSVFLVWFFAKNNITQKNPWSSSLLLAYLHFCNTLRWNLIEPPTTLLSEFSSPTLWSYPDKPDGSSSSPKSRLWPNPRLRWREAWSIEKSALAPGQKSSAPETPGTFLASCHGNLRSSPRSPQLIFYFYWGRKGTTYATKIKLMPPATWRPKPS
jgi:hypothetical protein